MTLINFEPPAAVVVEVLLHSFHFSAFTFSHSLVDVEGDFALSLANFSFSEGIQQSNAGAKDGFVTVQSALSL